MPKNEKYVVYTEEWILETPVTGDFTIEIVNNCPSKNSSSNKDRMTILSIDWEGAVPTHTHEYESTTTATCTAAGVTTYTCSCGDTYTEETEKLGWSGSTSFNDQLRKAWAYGYITDNTYQKYSIP